jgi:mannosyltransferase OCH1-like enzyme
MNKSSTKAIAEDDTSRSQYMRRLISDVDGQVMGAPDPQVPRVLVQFWDDAKAIPHDVKECIESWHPLEEQGFERLLFDDRSAERFITNNFDSEYLVAFKRCAHPAMRSDYFRLCYMLLKGGFYADADDIFYGGDIEGLIRDQKLKLQPLCYDTLTDSMVKSADFFTKHKDHPGWIYYVNNDPIIAPPGHPIIRMALERSTRILLADTADMTDIQSTTGPGNLTACLVEYAIGSSTIGENHSFSLLPDWDKISVSRWPLDYRSDERNWRLWAKHNA